MEQSHIDYIKGHAQFIRNNNLLIEELQNDIDYNEKVLDTTQRTIEICKERKDNTEKYSENVNEAFMKWCNENGYDHSHIIEVYK